MWVPLSYYGVMSGYIYFLFGGDFQLVPSSKFLDGTCQVKFSFSFCCCDIFRLSYVYWAVHHLDSWIKRDQLGVICFIISLFNAQHVSDVNTSILRSLRLICWVISWVVLLWFHVCWCYVVVWLFGVVSVYRLMQCFSLHTDTTPNNVTPTHGTIKEIYSWVKRDQLDVTCFIISLFNAQHVSDVNTSILRSLRLICW